MRDRRVRFVDGLTQDDSATFENGVRREIRFIRTEDVPLDLVHTVDFSSGVAPLAGPLRRAARRFVVALAGRVSSASSLSKTGPSCWPAANTTPRRSWPPSTGRRRDRWHRHARPDLSLALTLHGRDLAHQVIVLFTDGDDRPKPVVQGVEERICASQATVYVVTLGEGGSSGCAPRWGG